MKLPSMKLLLIGSLTLNFLVIGALVGAAFSDGRPDRTDRSRPPAAAAAPPEIGMLARGLSREDRRTLRQRLRADGTLRAGLTDIRAGRQDLLQALRAQPFDKDALDAAIATQRTVQSDLAATGADILSAIIADMTDAERTAYADRLESRKRRGPGRKSD